MAQVIVGFDGSEVARATLACAARRMQQGDHLTVAHVVAVPEAFLESPYFDQALERSREHGRRVLDESKGALPPRRGWSRARRRERSWSWRGSSTRTR